MRPYRQPAEPRFFHPTPHELEVMARMLLLLATLPNKRSRIDCAAMVMKYGLFDVDNPRADQLRAQIGLTDE